MLIYFDEHVPVYPVTTILLNEKLGVMPPVNWSKLLNLLGINPIFPPGYDYLPDTPPPIKTEYNRILSSNNLQNIKVLFNNYLTDKKFDKNSKYIESLRICSWMVLLYLSHHHDHLIIILGRNSNFYRYRSIR
jgi:hypothetical protein